MLMHEILGRTHMTTFFPNLARTRLRCGTADEDKTIEATTPNPRTSGTRKRKRKPSQLELEARKRKFEEDPLSEDYIPSHFNYKETVVEALLIKHRNQQFDVNRAMFQDAQEE